MAHAIRQNRGAWKGQPHTFRTIHCLSTMGNRAWETLFATTTTAEEGTRGHTKGKEPVAYTHPGGWHKGPKRKRAPWAYQEVGARATP